LGEKRRKDSLFLEQGKNFAQFSKLEAAHIIFHGEGWKTVDCYMKNHYNIVGGRMFQDRWKHLSNWPDGNGNELNFF
jgi:hypothetical protein